jgi:hypothetical protein
MQAFRKTVVTTVLLSVVLTGATFAAPIDRDGNQETRSRQVQKTPKPTNPWIDTLITILDWLSIPPG